MAECGLAAQLQARTLNFDGRHFFILEKVHTILLTLGKPSTTYVVDQRGLRHHFTALQYAMLYVSEVNLDCESECASQPCSAVTDSSS